MAIIKYKIHCNTENADKNWYLQDTDPTPSTCPTNTAHSVDLGSVAALGNSTVFNTLQDGTVVVQPITPANLHTLQPLGLVKKRFDPSAFAAPITLSNPQGDTFNYTCTLTPDGNWGYICSTDFSILVPIAGVDTVGGTVTVSSGMGSLLTGTDYILSNPTNIDYVLPTAQEFYELWGVFFSCNGYAPDDFGALQIVDTYGAVTGVPGYVLLTYDTVWIGPLSKLGKLTTPDDTPGQIPGSCTIRVQYYSSQTTSGQIDAYLDSIITILTPSS